ncbi:YbjQ family protein [Arenicella xantha]|uniref:Uncharacterized protein YbjQ (UPF0145 family) n=1 Tax=Arenicella xantha TaxID=644221 RepID=A0A395JEN8_9GAMM|nr:YbjQ family protein [Arenicella xantha]RBP47104.1 uncharacterized protein YbjQ (UPF0145 family) [Arenicella xantha]
MIEFVIFLSLILLGFGFGSYREKQHYRSIIEREAQYRDILVFESSYPKEQTDGHGGQLVQGSVVISADYFKTFVAGLRKLIGGRLRSYESLLDRGRREAVLRMKHEAHQAGANHVFNVRFETSSISKGESGTLSSVEVLVYGSAVKR